MPHGNYVYCRLPRLELSGYAYADHVEAGGQTCLELNEFPGAEYCRVALHVEVIHLLLNHPSGAVSEKGERKWKELQMITR